MWSFIFGTGFNCSCSFLSVFLRRSRLFFRCSLDADVDNFSLVNVRRNNCLWLLHAHVRRRGDFLLFLIVWIGAWHDKTRRSPIKNSHGNSVINSPSGSGGYNRCSFNLHNMKVCFWLCKQWCQHKKNNDAFFFFFIQCLCSFTENESLLKSGFKMICNVFIFLWNTPTQNEGKKKKRPHSSWSYL